MPYSSEFHRVSGWSTVNSPWLLPCCCDSLAGDTSAANGSQRPTSPPLITPVTPLRILRPSQKTRTGLFGSSPIHSIVCHFNNDALFYPDRWINFLTRYSICVCLGYLIVFLWPTVIDIFRLYLDKFFYPSNSPFAFISAEVKNTIFGNFLLKIGFFFPLRQNNKNRAVNRYVNTVCGFVKPLSAWRIYERRQRNTARSLLF